MKKLWLAILAAVVLCAASLAWAGHETGGGGHHEIGHEAGIDPKTLALQVFNFAVLIFILVKFGGSAVSKALRARHEQLKTALEDSARLRGEAEKRLQEQEHRLANLEQEITAMRAGIVREAESERTRMLSAAEEKATRVQAETRFLLDQQVKEAGMILRREVAEAAVQVAQELLSRSVDSDDDQRLARDFVAGIGGATPKKHDATHNTPPPEVLG